VVTNRRDLIAGGLAALLAGRPRAFAQQTAEKMPHIGMLTPASSDKTPVFDAFRRELHRLGYTEGRDIALEFRFSAGDTARLPQLAAELAAERVEVIVADSTSAALSAHKATQTIPIVLGAGVDPVLLGLATSHPKPGGNVTGFTLMTKELNAKRFQLLGELVPTAVEIAVLINSSTLVAEAFRREAEDGARRVGSRARLVPVTSPDHLRALAPSALAGVQGVIVLPDPMFWNSRGDILALVGAARLPAVYPEREYVDDGGLTAYGPSVPDNFRRAADYVDRILKGARVADLPIQQPIKFELVINLKTAKALGLTVPPILMAQADDVIE
jgi:putative tryptophan/tyrosine transport system substrate-binding protein